jgi:hypothetical protein
MNLLSRSLFAISFIALPCILVSQSHAQTSRKCSAIREGEQELEDASRALAKCASIYDPTDSCDGQFNEVKDAHDALDDAISDADDDCE